MDILTATPTDEFSFVLPSLQHAHGGAQDLPVSKHST